MRYIEWPSCGYKLVLYDSSCATAGCCTVAQHWHVVIGYSLKGLLPRIVAPFTDHPLALNV